MYNVIDIDNENDEKNELVIWLVKMYFMFDYYKRL